MKKVHPQPDSKEEGEEIRRLGFDYRCYKDVNELDGTAKRFYEVAAEAAGLSIRDLVRAVYSLEQMLWAWQQKERRRLKGEEE